MPDPTNLKITLSSPDSPDPAAMHDLTQRLAGSINAEGVPVERDHAEPPHEPGREYRSDLSSLYSLVVTLVNAGAVTAVVNALRAVFSSAPKSLTATITIGGRTLTLDAKNLDEKELDRLTALLTKDAPGWAA